MREEKETYVAIKLVNERRQAESTHDPLNMNRNESACSHSQQIKTCLCKRTKKSWYSCLQSLLDERLTVISNANIITNLLPSATSNYVLGTYSLDNSLQTQEAQENERALKEFLIDIECLDALTKWTNRFNIFDVLKITRNEIRHSNMLAWLLDPSENHGLNDNVLTGFVRFATCALPNGSLFEDLLMDCGDFFIQREWRNIDLIAMSGANRYVLCIENKISTGEHSDQLNRYRAIIEETYPEYRHRFILLSPEGIEASDSAHWHSMEYQDVLDILESALASSNPGKEASNLINNYIEMIRRDIVEDAELAQVCREIYAKHKRAIDLIIENIPDKISDLSSIFRDWATVKKRKAP